jgi:hypothetical protein
MGKWLNADGLYIKWGTDEAEHGTSGAYADIVAGTHIVEAVIDLTKLSTSAQTILDDNARIPKNYRLDKVEYVVDTAATSGGAATLDVGFVSAADRSTEVDHDGALAAVALSAINAVGNSADVRKGGTGAGAKVGATVSTSAVSLLVAKAGTAAFTAGKVRVRFFLRRV